MNRIPLTEDELKWLLVDFDGTIADNSGYPDFAPTTPIKDAVASLMALVSYGWKICIYTARPWGEYRTVESWCEQHHVPVRRIICGKPLGRYVIDDRNLEFSGDWKKILRRVRSPNKSTHKGEV